MLTALSLSCAFPSVALSSLPSVSISLTLSPQPPTHGNPPPNQPGSLVQRKEQWAQERDNKMAAEKIRKEGGGPGLVELGKQERDDMIQGLEDSK